MGILNGRQGIWLATTEINLSSFYVHVASLKKDGQAVVDLPFMHLTVWSVTS